MKQSMIQLNTLSSKTPAKVWYHTEMNLHVKQIKIV